MESKSEELMHNIVSLFSYFVSTGCISNLILLVLYSTSGSFCNFNFDKKCFQIYFFIYLKAAALRGELALFGGVCNEEKNNKIKINEMQEI